jgi:hypothetical protein
MQEPTDFGTSQVQLANVARCPLCHPARWLLLVALSVSAFLAPAAAIDSCSDRTTNGRYECTYEPQIIEPWVFSIPGPIEGTRRKNLTDDAVLEEYAGILARNCPTCSLQPTSTSGGPCDASSAGP